MRLVNNKNMKLDIGSGRATFKDYITVDKDPSVGAKLTGDCFDLKYGAHLANGDYIGKGEVDEIRAHHIFEHLDPSRKVELMSILWDLLKDGGILDIEVPLFPHPASIQDPTHISYWCKESFWYFIKGNTFSEAFAKRYSQHPVPLFTFVEEWTKGDVNNPWAYGIRLKK